MRIVVSGGGTAGHISPTLATLDALKQSDPDLQVLYLGSGSGMEAKIVRSAGWEFAHVPAGKLRRFHGRRLWRALLDVKTTALNIRDLARALAGFRASRRLLKQYRPQVVFVKGGFVGLPVGLAARSLSIPLVIHESDVTPGLTNRILGRWADKVAVGFPVERYRDFEPEKLVHTGNPILLQVRTADRDKGIKRFNLSSELPVVLVTGGSQGARVINQTILDALPQLAGKVQIIHLTGERDFEAVASEAASMNLPHGRYQAHAFLLEDLGLALAAATVVVSRAGANTIAELSVLAKPAILIPHPGLAGNHQTLNALTLARLGAVRMITEDRLTAQVLIAEIDKVINSDHERQLLSQAIAKLAVPDAANRLAHLILGLAPEEGGHGQAPS